MIGTKMQLNFCIQFVYLDQCVKKRHECWMKMQFLSMTVGGVYEKERKTPAVLQTLYCL